MYIMIYCTVGVTIKEISCFDANLTNFICCRPQWTFLRIKRNYFETMIWRRSGRSSVTRIWYRQKIHRLTTSINCAHTSIRKPQGVIGYVFILLGTKNWETSCLFGSFAHLSRAYINVLTVFFLYQPRSLRMGADRGIDYLITIRKCAKRGKNCMWFLFWHNVVPSSICLFESIIL